MWQDLRDFVQDHNENILASTPDNLRTCLNQVRARKTTSMCSGACLQHAYSRELCHRRRVPPFNLSLFQTTGGNGGGSSWARSFPTFRISSCPGAAIPCDVVMALLSAPLCLMLAACLAFFLSFSSSSSARSAISVLLWSYNRQTWSVVHQCLHRMAHHIKSRRDRDRELCLLHCSMKVFFVACSPDVAALFPSAVVVAFLLSPVSPREGSCAPLLPAVSRLFALSPLG